MKKLLSLLLVGVMSVMLLAGCGTTGGGQDNPDSGSDETEKSIHNLKISISSMN